MIRYFLSFTEKILQIIINNKTGMRSNDLAGGVKTARVITLYEEEW